MPLSPTEKAILLSELTGDPLSLGYAGKTNAEKAAIMNTPGSASEPNRTLSVADWPVIVKATAILDLIAQIDGWDGSNNIYGAGADKVLDWIARSNDLVAARANYFWNAAADVDMTTSESRASVDYLAGVDENPFVPGGRTLVSDQAMTAVLELGMVLNSRAKEIMSRPVTEADITEALS